MSGNLGRIARKTLARIPGALESAWRARDLVAPARHHPGRTFSSWMEDLASISKPPDLPLRILFFACRSGWINISLAIVTVLLSRGAEVQFVYLPLEAMDGADPLEEQRRFHYHYRKYLSNGRHPRLSFTDLSYSPPAILTPQHRQEAEAQSLFDTRSLRLREEVDVQRNSEDRTVFEFRLRRNLDCMARIAGLLQPRACDLVILPNGTLRELGIVYRVSRLAGIPTNTFEFFDRSQAIVVAHNHPAAAPASDEYWNPSAAPRLSGAARSRVQEYIATRLGTVWKGFSWKTQRAPYRGDRDAVLSQLNLGRSGRRIVLLCPNIPWDSSLMSQDRAFPTHQEWIRQTARYFARRDDTHLIIRSHPDEMIWGTTEPLAELVRQTAGSPEHITVVAAADPVNTYDLMDLCDIGLVYNSTAGMEMALRGIPTVVAGCPHYADKGFTRDAASPAEYFRALDESLSPPRGTRLSARQIELAWCYADAYLFAWQKPFPWSRSTLWQDLETWPMARVLGEEGRGEFRDAIDLLLSPSRQSGPQL